MINQTNNWVHLFLNKILSSWMAEHLQQDRKRTMQTFLIFSTFKRLLQNLGIARRTEQQSRLWSASAGTKHENVHLYLSVEEPNKSRASYWNVKIIYYTSQLGNWRKIWNIDVNPNKERCRRHHEMPFEELSKLTAVYGGQRNDINSSHQIKYTDTNSFNHVNLCMDNDQDWSYEYKAEN